MAETIYRRFRIIYYPDARGEYIVLRGNSAAELQRPHDAIASGILYADPLARAKEIVDAEYEDRKISPMPKRIRIASGSRA